MTGVANVDESVDSSSGVNSSGVNSSTLMSGDEVLIDDGDNSFTFYEVWNHEIHILKAVIDEKIQNITERSQKEIERIAATVTGNMTKQGPSYRIRNAGPKIPPSQWAAYRATMKQQYQQHIQQQQREQSDNLSFSPMTTVEPRTGSLSRIDYKKNKGTQHRDIRLSPSGRSHTTATSDKTIPQSNLSSHVKQPYTICNVLSIPEEASLLPSTEEENENDAVATTNNTKKVNHSEISSSSSSSSRSESLSVGKVPLEIIPPASATLAHDFVLAPDDVPSSKRHIDTPSLQNEMKSTEGQNVDEEEIKNDIPSMMASMSLSSTSEKSDRSNRRTSSSNVVVASEQQQSQSKPPYRIFDTSKERRIRMQNNSYPWHVESIQAPLQQRQRDAPQSTMKHGQYRPDAPASSIATNLHPIRSSEDGNVNETPTATLVVADKINFEAGSMPRTEETTNIGFAPSEINRMSVEKQPGTSAPPAFVFDKMEYSTQPPTAEALASIPSIEETLPSITDREVSAICEMKTDTKTTDDDNNVNLSSKISTSQRRKQRNPPSPETFMKVKRKKVSTSPNKNGETNQVLLESIGESTMETGFKNEGKETYTEAPSTDIISYNNERRMQPHACSLEPSLIRLEYVTNRKIKDPYSDEGLYTGILILGKPETHGTMTYKDGRYYTGSWKRGRWNGHGKAIFTNGDTYTGDYIHDQRHGIGRYEWSDARVYDGRFDNDQREGHGTYSWPNGSVYCGEFHLGLRHGFGTYTYEDGSVYSGEWQNGKQHGNGECIWANSRSFRGEWIDGRTHIGVEIRADGTIRQDGVRRRNRPVRTKDNQETKRNVVQGQSHPPIRQRQSFESDQSAKPTIESLRQGKCLIRNISDTLRTMDKFTNKQPILPVAGLSTSMSE